MVYSSQLLTATVVRLIVHSQLLGIEDSQFDIALSYETLAATPEIAAAAQKPPKINANSTSLTQLYARIRFKNRIFLEQLASLRECVCVCV